MSYTYKYLFWIIAVLGDKNNNRGFLIMLAFCEVCRDMLEYVVNEVNKTKKIKGKKVTYKGEEAYCKECGSNVFVQEIRDFNLKRLEEAYRRSQRKTP